VDPRFPRQPPRPLSVERPKPPPSDATDREFAIWCANLAAQCVHNWGAAQSWLEMLSAQIRELDARVGGVEEREPLPEMRDKAASIHDIEEVVGRVVGEGRKVNSERVREITTETITRKGYDELSRDERERKKFYLSVVLLVIAAVLGVIGGRLLPH
jgi:hypothetical protein